MITFDKTKRYLIIADTCYRQVILSVKSIEPEFDFSFMTKPELLSLLTFDYTDDPIPFLLKQEKEDFSTLNTYLRVLKFAERERGVNSRLDEIYDLLYENGYINIDPLAKKELSLYDTIYFFEGHEDFEMKTLLEKEDIHYQLLDFEDLGYKDRRTSKEFYLYPDKTSQFCSLYSHIRKDILNGEKEASDIAITIHAESDDFYIKWISDLFKVPTETVRTHPKICKKDDSDKLKEIQRSRSFEFTGEEKKNCFDLYSIVERYGLGEMKDFDFAYLNLLEILSSSPDRSQSEISGVKATTSISFTPDTAYYVTNFIHDDFYKVYSDSGRFTDRELLDLKCNPSYVSTKIDRRKKQAFLKYMDVRFLSRVERHQSDKMYNSQFAKDKDSDPDTEEKEYVQVKKDFDRDGLYTTEAYYFVRNIYKDRYGYPEDDEYCTYDHSFSGVEGEKKTKFGVTSLDDYFKCPFFYYLKHIIEIDRYDPNADFFYAHLGTIIHHVFEHIHTLTDEEFDFDTLYNEGIQKVMPELKSLNESAREHELSMYEWNRGHVEMFARTLRLQNSRGHIIDETAEKSINFNMTSDETGNTYTVTGIIDKLLYTSYFDEQIGSTKNYWTLIDYKTGYESFDPKTVFLGNHLQLPLYYLYVKDDEKLNKGYIYGGFGIEHIYTNSPSKVKRLKPQPPADHLSEYTKRIRLSGVANKNPDYMMSFEGVAQKLWFLSTSSSFTDVESDGSMSTGFEYSYKDMIEDARKAALKTMDSISANEFEIAPSNIKGDETHCKFCNYKNICYKSESDTRHLIPDIKSRFNNGGSEEEEDE